MSDQYGSVFHEWEGLGRLSNNAFQLHGMAIIESVRVGSPGWIDDERLSSLVTNSIQGAVELEAAGVWVMALIEIPQSCSSEFLRSRGQVSAGSCRS